MTKSLRNCFFVFALVGLFGFDGLNILTAQTNVGTGQTYTTLKSAFDAINNGTLTGNVQLIITSNLTETSSAVLFASGTGSSNYTSVTITPDAASEKLINGNIPGPLLDFDGADNVLIDGQYLSSGSFLRLRNENSSYPTIRFINDASNDTLAYSYVESGDTMASSGAIVVSTSTGITGNDNITINNCQIRSRSDVAVYPSIAVFVDGTLGAENDHITISNCRIYDFTNYGIYFSPSSYLGGYYTINGNHFYNTTISNQSQDCISSLNINKTGHDWIITGNYFGGSGAYTGGFWTKSGGNFSAITLSAGGGGSPVSIQGNYIQNIKWSSSFGDFVGLGLNGDTADYNVGTTIGNRISNISNSATANVCRFTGIYSIANHINGSVQITNNIIEKLYNYSTDSAAYTHGIFQEANACVYSINGNAIHDFISLSSFLTFGQIGIMMNANAYAGTSISGNLIFNISNENTGVGPYNIVGINVNGTPSGSFTVARNRIWNLRLVNQSNASVIYGIRMVAGFGDFSNNMISLGNGVTGDYAIIGIRKPTGNSNFYYNTIFLDGTVTNGSANSFAFERTGLGTNVLKDNIFYNSRTGGTGKHYAIQLDNTTGLTSDYNVLFTSDTNYVGSFDGGVTLNSFSSWQTNSGFDANSMSVPGTFLDITNGDLHLAGSSIGDNNLSGTPLTEVTTDFDGDSRALVYPYMGADENTTAPLSQWKLTSTANVGGSISPLGDTFVNRGKNQSYTITPSAHYHLDSVVVDGVNHGAVSGYSFNRITSNHTIAAHFSIDNDTITTAVIGSGTISPSGSISVPYGGDQKFSVTPDFGFHIDSILVDGSRVDSTTSYTFKNVISNHSISAYFTINTYTITASAGLNGTITPAGNINILHGGSQRFTFDSNAGYHLDSLLVDGIHVDSLTGYTFLNVTTNRTIHVSFAINKYTITATSDVNGTINLSGSVSVNYGASQHFSIMPNIGYHLDTLFVDGARSDSTLSYTFENVMIDHTIHAKFAINVYTITAGSTANGTITPFGVQAVNFGGEQKYIIEPAMGYHVDSLLIDGLKVDSTTSYTFKNVDANHSIFAKFVIDVFTITAASDPHGIVTPAGIVNVNYGAGQTFVATPNTGYHIDSMFVDGVHINSTISYTFTNVITNHSIFVKFAPDLFTIMASTETGGSINPSGAIIVSYGTNRQFTITPDAGYHLDTLLVDGTKVDSTTSYTFINIGTGHTIHAKFAINVYTINASANAGGSISPSGNVQATHGANQKFTYTPDTGYHFDSLKVDGVHVDSVSSFTFSNITTNHTIAAYFSINTYNINASSGTNGTISPSGIVNVNYGSSQRFTFTANPGYHIDSVFVDGAFIDSIAGYTFANVSSNHTISVIFAIDKYNITATAGLNGIITPSGVVSVSYGANQKFIITPDIGYRVDSVWVDGVYVDSTLSYTFTNVTNNHTIIVKFFINKYVINASVNGNGIIAPAGAVSVDYGSTQVFAITPNTGYHLDSIIVDGLRVDSTASYTFHNITSNHNISAFFSINKYTIETLTHGGGTINPSGTIVADYGSTKIFYITPNVGFHLDSIIVDGLRVDSTASYTFHNITSNHSITAFFSINKYFIEASTNGNGSITPSGTVETDYGSNLVFSFAPNTGYHIDNVIVDGVKVDSILSYTFINVTANHIIRAVFKINTYTITATSSGNGIINPSGAVILNYGSDQRFTFTPNVGYHLDSLTVDGVKIDSSSSYTFINVTAPHTINVKFKINTYNITATADTNGGITPSGIVTVNYGSNQTFTITPDVGYLVDSIVVDGLKVDSTTSYTFLNVTANHTIHATFKLTVGVNDKSIDMPKEFALHQNYPNPFNPTTNIRFDLPVQSLVTIDIYNILGNKVGALMEDRNMDAGFKEIQFDGSNIASGIYFYSITARGVNGKVFTSVMKMMLIK